MPATAQLSKKPAELSSWERKSVFNLISQFERSDDKAAAAAPRPPRARSASAETAEEMGSEIVRLRAEIARMQEDTVVADVGAEVERLKREMATLKKPPKPPAPPPVTCMHAASGGCTADEAVEVWCEEVELVWKR